jgi:hypothetical protein
MGSTFTEQDDDLLVWLSEQWWTPWLMLSVFCVIGFWMVRSLVIHRGRSGRIERAAAAAGMDYREQDGFGLSRVAFAHMERGDGRGWTASQVVTFTARDGLDVHAFDVRSWADVVVSQRDSTGDSTKRLVRKHRGATRTAAMAPLPINAPRLVVGRENAVSKLFVAATRIDLDVESEAFNRNYHVIGDDRRFARSLLDAQMIDLMVSTEGKITFEFFGRWVLLHTEQLDPTLLPGLARLADRTRRLVPRLLIDRATDSPR